MTKIFYINMPNTSSTVREVLPVKNLWYDVKLKKMIEIDGDLNFNYNYSNGSLDVSGKNVSHNHEIDRNNTNIVSDLEREYDFNILNKSISNNNIEITIELFGDIEEFCDTLDHHELVYRYE